MLTSFKLREKTEVGDNDTMDKKKGNQGWKVEPTLDGKETEKPSRSFFNNTVEATIVGMW